MNAYNQTLFVVWINQIIFFTLCWYIDLTLLHFLSIVLILFLFSCMSEISIHRYFSHKSFNTSPKKEKFLIFCASLIGQGSVLSWVAVHRAHHAYEDTEKDPHSPFFIPIWKIFLGLFPKFNYKVNLVGDLLKSPNRKYLNLQNKYYYVIYIFLWIFLGIVSLDALFLFTAGSAIWYINTQLVNIFAHKGTGPKVFKNSVAINSKLLNLLTGAGNHNNHHANPKNYSYKVTNEVDIHGFLIKKLFKQ